MKKFSPFYLFFLLPIAIMIVIFMFSSEDAEKSTKTSTEVVEVVANVVVKDYKEKPAAEKKSIIDSLQNTVRKSAHFTIYLLLGASWLIALKINSNFKNWILCIISQIASSVYAISDEIHQGFVDGRGPGVLDVLLDSFGALIGILITLLVIFIISKIASKKKVAQIQ